MQYNVSPSMFKKKKFDFENPEIKDFKSDRRTFIRLIAFLSSNFHKNRSINVRKKEKKD